MTPEERSLEAGIRVNTQAMRATTTPESKRAAFRLLAELHGLRSDEMVERGGPGLGDLAGPAPTGASDEIGVAPGSLLYTRSTGYGKQGADQLDRRGHR